MEIRPIKTEEDYRAMLREIEMLMDATPGSAEEDRLDVLATLVQAYEAKHYPDRNQVSARGKRER